MYRRICTIVNGFFYVQSLYRRSDFENWETNRLYNRIVSRMIKTNTELIQNKWFMPSFCSSFRHCWYKLVIFIRIYFFLISEAHLLVPLNRVEQFQLRPISQLISWNVQSMRYRIIHIVSIYTLLLKIYRAFEPRHLTPMQNVIPNVLARNAQNY